MITEQGLDAFFRHPIVAGAFVWAPLLVYGVSLWLMRRQHIAVKIISPLLFAFSTLALCIGIPLGWVLRDGLAPGVIVSHGDEAVSRFMKDFWSLPIFCGAIFLLGLLPCCISTFMHSRQRQLQAHSVAVELSDRGGYQVVE